MLEIYEKVWQKRSGSLEVDRKDVSKYGIVDGKLIEEDIYLIDDLIEKPKRGGGTLKPCHSW
jgi:UDP-glucose pyrophosphorylase